MGKTKALENEYLAVFKSQNHAIYVYGKLSTKGVISKVVQTPCSISTSCTHSIKFKEQYMDTVINEIKEDSIKIRGIYKIEVSGGKKHYNKVS